MSLFPIIVTFIFSFIVGQENPKIYWNSLATDVTIGVPLADDETLIGGRVQIRASFNEGELYSDIGNTFIINKKDIDDLKEVSIPKNIFEPMQGFKEGSEAQFIAEVWDKAGNSIIGSVSDSILTIDQILPVILNLIISSSNELDSGLAMPGDSITFQIDVSEPIQSPMVIINGDDYDAIGSEKSWAVVYPADDGDDGQIQFKIDYKDLAENPGATIIMASNKKVIIIDGTPPELEDIQLFTSNEYDSLLAIEGDSVYLKFNSSERIRNLSVSLNYNEATLQTEDSLGYTFYHVFTKEDSENVIPIRIDYKDMAGNLGETVDETSNDSEVRFDMTPPSDFKVETVGYIELKKKQNLVNTLVSDSTVSDIPAVDEAPSFLREYFLIGLLMVGLLILITWVSFIKIFSKAGQAGWKALVPFLNLFIFTKIVNKPIWWIIIYLIFPVSSVLVGFQLSKLFNKKRLFTIGLILFPFIFIPLIAFGKAQVLKDQGIKEKQKLKKKVQKKIK